MIILKNPGLIDIDFFKLMGVNVKESDDPIGQFGTGLKYAVAVFLREGIDFKLYRGKDCFEFHTIEKTLRGKQFHICCLQGPHDHIEFGFTTDLGKNWEVWQGYREIHSNCLDEGGEIYESNVVQSEEGYTTFVINSKIDIHDIFIDENKTALFYSNEVDIYEGESDYIYYHGIRAKKLRDEEKSMYTYNIKSYCTLTEDRLLCYDHQIEEIITKALTKMENKEIIKNIITASTGYEKSIRPDSGWCPPKPSKTLVDVFSENRAHVNTRFVDYFKSHEPKKPRTPEERRSDFMVNLKELCHEYRVDVSTAKQQLNKDVIVLSGGVLE